MPLVRAVGAGDVDGLGDLVGSNVTVPLSDSGPIVTLYFPSATTSFTFLRASSGNFAPAISAAVADQLPSIALVGSSLATQENARATSSRAQSGCFIVELRGQRDGGGSFRPRGGGEKQNVPIFRFLQNAAPTPRERDLAHLRSAAPTFRIDDVAMRDPNGYVVVFSERMEQE